MLLKGAQGISDSRQTTYGSVSRDYHVFYPNDVGVEVIV